MSAPEQSKSRRHVLAAASDSELIADAFVLAGKFWGPEEIRDELYAVLTEAFERWSPEATWSDVVYSMRDHAPSDLRFELEASRDAMVERAALRLASRCSIEVTS